MTVGVVHRLVAAAGAMATTSRARAGAPRLIGERARWDRTNHRGESVSMLEGPAMMAGLLVGGIAGAPNVRVALAATVATAGGGAFGLIDDLTEDTTSRTKGLRGHLGALAHGELTTGGLKVLGIGASALVAAAIVPSAPSSGVPGSAPRSLVGWAFDVATSGALIAATANLINLLDLRPGRALKAASLAAAPLALLGGNGAGLAAAVIGAGVGAAPGDLAERDMLGDSGANALGALLGTAVVAGAPRGVRLVLLVGAVGLTVASERVSFTKVIAATPVLRELDAWGRRPAPATFPGTEPAEPAADLPE
ncbi:MAG: hypothetical protein ACOH2F_17800 [Cellulomonas sp.]